MAHFEIQNLTFTYPTAGGRPSLTDVSLTVEPGEYVVLCGRSGSGKTTLLRHLKSVLTPHGKRSGRILFCGTPLEEVPQEEQAARIGYVMQNPDEQIVTDKVWHELAFGLESLGCDQKTMRARVAEMACYFGIQDWFHRDVDSLSGGQKQLLNLASVMAMQPEVLILDEPTSQLDPIAASDFLNTVRKINLELGTTVLITEHRLEDILPAADRAVVMEGGRILVADVPRRTAGFLWAEHHPMFSAMPAPTRVFYGAQGKGVCPLTVREGRNWLLGAFQTPPEVTALPEAPVAWEERPSALVLKEVWFRYEKNSPDVLRGVSAVVPEGSLFAIVGGNGAGKSTMLKAICGICKPYRGKIRVFGKKVEAYGGTELFRNCLAMLPQDPKSLFVKKTVREDLEEMCRDREKLEAVARTCEVEALLDSHPYDLSGGEQQRAALAKVLLTEPRLLLLDEPTKGMDGFFKEKLARILEKLKAQGMTVVMVSHDVEFCAQYGDLISMFFDGQILTTAPPRRFFGQNSFYTTAANRMSRCMFQNAVTAEHVVALYRANGGGDGDDT
ncbi:MAG: ABC transporter ATP-binding protein [Oscillospiraceae bacterium]|nr:ATP-binding cassette domain-containing protein [Bacillota bacterium]